MNKQEFIIETLKPYFLDRNLCGYNKELEKCEYLTHDGKMCAVGTWLDKNNPHYESVSKSEQHVIAMNSIYDLNTILKDDAKNILNISEWYYVQNIHDKVAQGKSESIIMGEIDKLEKCSKTDLTELKQLCENF